MKSINEAIEVLGSGIRNMKTPPDYLICFDELAGATYDLEKISDITVLHIPSSIYIPRWDDYELEDYHFLPAWKNDETDHSAVSQFFEGIEEALYRLESKG